MYKKCFWTRVQTHFFYESQLYAKKKSPKKYWAESIVKSKVRVQSFCISRKCTQIKTSKSLKHLTKNTWEMLTGYHRFFLSNSKCLIHRFSRPWSVQARFQRRLMFLVATWTKLFWFEYTGCFFMTLIIHISKASTSFLASFSGYFLTHVCLQTNFRNFSVGQSFCSPK